MNCDICAGDTRVLSTEGVKRRRECIICKHRFSTTEVQREELLRMEDSIKGARELARKILEEAG